LPVLAGQDKNGVSIDGIFFDPGKKLLQALVNPVKLGVVSTDQVFTILLGNGHVLAGVNSFNLSPRLIDPLPNNFFISEWSLVRLIKKLRRNISVISRM